MKKHLILFLFVVMLTATTTIAQTRFENWPEMHKYEIQLNKMYDPAVDGDMEPVKTGSHQLLASCKLVTLSHYPQQYDKDDVKAAMKVLEKETDKLNAFVVRAEQRVSIMKQLNAVQNAFGKVEQLCKNATAPATAAEQVK